MINSRVDFLVKIPICCWDINKTRQGITFICRTLYMTLCVCFPRLPRGFPFQAFLPTAFTETFVVPVVVIFRHLNRSF